jgi:Tfp pilus assembly protein PilW
MYILKKIQKNEGLTLVELLVSLLLTTIVIVIVFFIFLTSSKAYLAWETESSFIDSARLLVRSLDNSIAAGVSLAEAKETSLIMKSSDLSASRYETDADGRLYKNGSTLIPADYRVADLEFKYVIGSNEGSMLIKEADQLDLNGDFIVTETELAEISGVQYSFTLKGRKNSESYNGLVMMRKF